jgi:predicted RNA methylase
MSSFSAQAPIAADWLVAMPDVVAPLDAAVRPRIADVGCGQGFSTLAIAKAFLGAHVDGFDLGLASIADARRHGAEAGLDGRVRFGSRWCLSRTPSSASTDSTPKETQ